jgi:hypothetical protein
MDLIMDGLLIAGAAFAGVWCWVLAGRVERLKALDSGLGGAIVQLTRQIELARSTLDEARAGSRETRQDLAALVGRADSAAAQLRLLLAAAERAPAPPAEAPAPAAHPSPPDAPAARRRDAPGPRLVSLAEPAPPPEPPLAAGADDLPVPKPRRVPPLDGLLRPRRAPEARPAPTEAELVAELSALAAAAEH